MNNDELAFHSQELIQKHMLLDENELQIQKPDVDDNWGDLGLKLNVSNFSISPLSKLISEANG